MCIMKILGQIVLVEMTLRQRETKFPTTIKNPQSFVIKIFKQKSFLLIRLSIL